MCINIYTPKKPLCLDLPVNLSKSMSFSGVDIGRSNSTPLTFNSWFNLESVTTKFWFDKILLIINEVVGFPLLMCSKATDSGLLPKDLTKL